MYYFFSISSTFRVSEHVTTSSNQLTVSSAAIGKDDGWYRCVAYIDTVNSDASKAHVISCKSK